MSGHVVRYDPHRVAALQRRALLAADDLANLVSGDPAAADAVRVVNAARTGLQEQWLPLLARVVGNDAMRTWTSAAIDDLLGRFSELLSGFSAVHGSDLGRALAETAEEIVADGDVDDIVDLTTALERSGDDVEAMHTFFAELGGGGLAELAMYLGTEVEHADDALALAGVLRTRLAEATVRPGFPADLAPELVGRFAEEITDSRRNPAAAMAYLFDDTAHGTDFLVATTRALVDRELTEAGDEPQYGASMWGLTMGFAPGSILNRQLDDTDDGNWSSELLRGGDPMYALLEGIARDGDAGRILFTDERVAGYLLGQRDLRLDGMRSLAAAAETAAAGPDVVVGASDELLDDAATVASAFVNHVGWRDPDVVWELYDNDAVSRSAATILGQHLFAVHNAVLLPEPLGEPRGEVIAIADEARGDGAIATGALFDEHALNLVTDLAVDTTDGVATIRAGLDLHQQTQASLGAGRIAAGEIADVNSFLREAIADAARLEAYFIEHAGHRAEANERRVDEVIGLWIDLASFSIGTGNGQFQRHGGSAGRLAAPVVGEFLGPAADVARSLFATHEAQAAREATEQAEDAADQLTYVWYRELYARGVIAPDLPDHAVAGDELVGWDEFQELDPAVRQVTRNRLEETSGAGGVNIDGNALRDVVKVQQLPIYDELD